MIQRMLTIWSLVPLPFLNPAWTFGSSQFTYCWSLACRIWALLQLPWGIWNLGFPGGLAGNKSAHNAGDLGLIPGLGRSPGEGKSYPLQYSGLKNSMDYIVHGVAKSWIWLSNFHFHFSCGTFPDQGSNLCPLHWQADSQALDHQGSPWIIYCVIHLHLDFSIVLQNKE